MSHVKLLLSAVAVATLVSVALAQSGTGATCTQNSDCLSKFCYKAIGRCSCQACELNPAACPSGCASPAVCVFDFSRGGTCVTPLPDGSPCSRDVDCLSTRCTAPYFPAVCVATGPPGSACKNSTTCPQGSACVSGKCSCSPCERSSTCPAGCIAPETCVSDGLTQSAICAVGGLPLGEACSQTAVCASRTCVAGVCVAALGPGGACTEDEMCASGACQSGRCACLQACTFGPNCPGGCAPPHRCEDIVHLGASRLACLAPRPNGANCTFDQACVSGHCSSQARCAPKLAANRPCTSNSQCASGVCAFNSLLQAQMCTCSPTCEACQAGCPAGQQCVGADNRSPGAFCFEQRALGAACTADASCESLHCDPTSSTCAPPLQTGQACTSGQACPGAVCPTGTCFCDAACGPYHPETCPAGCVPPQSCLVDEAGHRACGVAPAEGRPCVNGSFVASCSFCIEGVTRLTLLPLGAPCSGAPDCASFACGITSRVCTCNVETSAGCAPDEACEFLGLNGADPRCGPRYPQGVRCVIGQQCASGVCAVPFCTGTGVWGAACKLNDDCLSAKCVSGKCACDDSGRAATCPTGQTCVAAYQGALPAPTCVSLLDVGQSCTDDAYCSSTWCHEGVCATPLPPGKPCSESFSVPPVIRCASGQCVDGVCGCLEDGDCPVGETCKQGRCGANKAVGEACRGGRGCETGFCFRGVCSDRLGLGALCSKNEGCYSQTCLGGRCGQLTF